MTATMTQYEAVQQLSEKMHITLEEARATLEAGDWNMLTATHMLEQEDFRRKQELSEAAAAAADAFSATEKDVYEQVETNEKATASDTRTGETMKKLGRVIMDLIARGNRSRLVVHKGGERLMEVPVTLLVLLLVCSFGTCAFLMVIGLFAGCRYSFNEKGISSAEA